MKYLNYFHINENVASAKSLLLKNDLTEDSDVWKHIRTLLKGHDGYVFWFLNQNITNEVPLSELDRIWNTIKDNNGILSFFKTNIIDLKTTEDFWDEYSQAVIKQRIRKLYNEFPSKQKKFFDLNNKEDFDILDALSLDKGNNTIITKISVFKTKDSLLLAINRLLNNKTGNEYDKLITNLQSLYCPIIYGSKDDEIIICSVDYNAITKLGSDTAWCIVRSEHTFNNYTSTDLSIQYIIFLLDMDNNYSKIGLTVNINGYYTSHLKNDSSISKESLEIILNERGTSITNLLPKKENVTDKILNNATVQGLLTLGFSKEEILNKKEKYKTKHYNQQQIQSDLSFFSKEEIDEYKLLDKTELGVEDLKKYTIQEIIDRKLLNRVTYYSIDNVLDLGFDITNIDKVIDADKFPELKTMVKKIKSFKKRENVVKYILDKRYDGVEWSERDAYANTLVKLCKLGPNDLPW